MSLAMDIRNTYWNVTLLMIGVGAVVIFGAVVFFVTPPQHKPSLSEIQPNIALEALARTELAHLSASGMIHTDTVLALGSELGQEAADAVRATSLMWTQEAGWLENQGIPPLGTVLVRRLDFNDDQGFVTVVVGELASLESCGITVESSYVWRSGWQDRSGSMTMC